MLPLAGQTGECTKKKSKYTNLEAVLYTELLRFLCTVSVWQTYLLRWQLEVSKLLVLQFLAQQVG